MGIRLTTVIPAVGGVALLALSLVRGWVATERVIVGYGSARVVWSADAWAGFFAPWLPAAVILAVAASVLVVAGGRSRWIALIGTILALAGVTLFAAVLAIGHDTLTPNPSNTWKGEAGVLVGAGIGLAGVIAIGGILSLMSDRPARTTVLATGLLALVLVVGACSSTTDPSPSSSASAVADVPDWRTDPNEPYPFMTPIPGLMATDIDGEYLRAAPTDTYTGTRAACRRCPPYPVDRGISTLVFDRGRYQIIHLEPAYRSFGHFEIDDDTLTVWNDPECSDVRGTYRIEREGAQLRLEVIEDGCGFGRRGNDLTALTWTLSETARGGPCQPPNTEAAISGHWAAPSGC